MDFSIHYTKGKVVIKDSKGQEFGQFNNMEAAHAFLAELSAKGESAKPLTVSGFIVAREAPDLKTYDVPEKAVSSEEAADIIERFTIREVGDE